MNKINLIVITTLLLAFSATGYSQNCPGALLSDGFNNPALWTSIGATGPGPGTISVTGGAMTWSGMSPQLFRLYRDVSAALPNNDLWRIDWDFRETSNNTRIGGLMMSLTSDIIPTRYANLNQPPETNQNTIEVLVGNPLNGASNPQYFFVSSKFGTTRTNVPTLINFTTGTQYYLRLQRTSPGNAVFSVYLDAAHTTHAPGSPLCFNIDPRIDNLTFIQQGMWTSNSPNRRLDAVNDNLCIFDNITQEGCNAGECEITPVLDLAYSVTNCTVTFTDMSTFGFGTTMLPGHPIDFGDGTTGIVPPGGSVSHTYPGTGHYYACMTVFGYDSEFNCCTERDCRDVFIECENDLNPDEKVAVQDENGIVLFPNPSQNRVQIRSKKAIHGLRIYDLNGKSIQTDTNLDQNALEIDVEQMPVGVYFIELDLGDEVITRKFSKM